MRKKPTAGTNDAVLEEQARRVAPKLAVLIVSEIFDLSPATIRLKYVKRQIGDGWVDLAKVCLLAAMRSQANWHERK